MDSNENEFTSESQQIQVSNSIGSENAIWSIKGLKKSALELLKGRWKIPLIASLITIGITICLMVAVYPWDFLFSTDVSTLDVASISVRIIVRMLGLYAVMLLVCPVVVFAYLMLIQKMRKTKENIKFNDYVEGFSFWNKGILATLWQFLCFFLWFLLFFVCFAIIMSVSVLLINAKLSFVGTAIIFVGCIILYVFIFSKYYSYCMNLYILANNPKIKIKKALALSIKITKGYRGKLFLMDLSFIGWYFLCCLTLGIGIIFYSPYYMMTVSNACEFLTKQAINNGVVKAEDFEEQDAAVPQNEEQN